MYHCEWSYIWITKSKRSKFQIHANYRKYMSITSSNNIQYLFSNENRLVHCIILLGKINWCELYHCAWSYIWFIKIKSSKFHIYHIQLITSSNNIQYLYFFENYLVHWLIMFGEINWCELYQCAQSYIWFTKPKS